MLMERHGCHGHAAQAGTHHCDAAPASFPGFPRVCRVPSSSPGHRETGDRWLAVDDKGPWGTSIPTWPHPL